jgi:hypothetical protein
MHDIVQIFRSWTGADEAAYQRKFEKKLARRAYTERRIAASGLDYDAEVRSDERRVSSLLILTRNDIESAPQFFREFARIFGCGRPLKLGEHLGKVALKDLRDQGLAHWKRRRLVPSDAGLAFLKRFISPQALNEELAAHTDE